MRGSNGAWEDLTPPLLHWGTRFDSGGNAKTRAAALALRSSRLRGAVAREPLQKAPAHGLVLVADEPHADHPAPEGVPLVFRFARLRAGAFLIDGLRRGSEGELQGRPRLVGVERGGRVVGEHLAQALLPEREAAQSLLGPGAERLNVDSERLEQERPLVAEQVSQVHLRQPISLAKEGVHAHSAVGSPFHPDCRADFPQQAEKVIHVLVGEQGRDQDAAVARLLEHRVDVIGAVDDEPDTVKGLPAQRGAAANAEASRGPNPRCHRGMARKSLAPADRRVRQAAVQGEAPVGIVGKPVLKISSNPQDKPTWQLALPLRCCLC